MSVIAMVGIAIVGGLGLFVLGSYFGSALSKDTKAVLAEIAAKLHSAPVVIHAPAPTAIEAHAVALHAHAEALANHAEALKVHALAVGSAPAPVPPTAPAMAGTVGPVPIVNMVH